MTAPIETEQVADNRLGDRIIQALDGVLVPTGWGRLTSIFGSPGRTWLLAH